MARFTSSQEIVDYHRWLETDDELVFPVEGGKSIEFRLRSYRPKTTDQKLTDKESVKAIRDAAGISAEQMLNIAQKHYSVDSCDQSSTGLGDRWPERNNDHGNSPSEMSNMIIEIFKLIEERRNPTAKGYRTTPQQASPIKSGGLVVASIDLRLGTPNLDINVR